jgi:hypothetical protein
MAMGFEYATDGTMEIDGRKIEIIEKDTQLDPARARTLPAPAHWWKRPMVKTTHRLLSARSHPA